MLLGPWSERSCWVSAAMPTTIYHITNTLAACRSCQEALLAWSQEPWQKARCSVHQAGAFPKRASFEGKAQQLCEVGIAYSGGLQFAS